MQSSTHRRDNSYISLGERRGKSDLARFSLDLSWASAVSDSARIRAYPSPPMSGSPPLPPRRNPDSSDRGHGSYGSVGQEVFRGNQMSQTELSEQSRGPLLRPYQDPLPPTAYTSYRMEDIPQLQYQPQVQQMTQPQHLAYPQQTTQTFTSLDRPATGETADYSPKAQRKTKGHVASACVPCKRAHLRCDAQRPCSRCLSNGKEDTCIDVQHKKRGRPRLRDEREPRYEASGPHYPPPPPAPEGSMRRPLSLYTPGDGPISSPFGDSSHRSGAYRVLKSQGGPHVGGSMAARFLEHATPAEANVYSGSMPAAPRMMASEEPICAYLTMDMQVAKATQGFGEMIGVQSMAGRKFHDIVSGSDRDKVFRLQRVFDDERREREPNYLPPIYPKFEEDRVIQSVGFGPDEMAQFRLDRRDMFTFQGPDGELRTVQVRIGLAKKDSTYFIILLLLNSPPTPQSFNQPSSSPYSRVTYSRDSQYGYQAPQQAFAQPGASPFMSNPSFGDPRGEMYRNPAPIGPNIAPSPSMPPFAQQPRPDYSQGQNPYQTPRSELPQGQPQLQRQHNLQLPPIRDQRGESETSMGEMRRRENQSGRVDIGGLLEKPGMGRGGE